MASHGSGHAPLDSLRRDIAILTASGEEWSARIRRLAARVPTIDIFGVGHVIHHADGWQITQSGRDFLASLEAVTQDNLASWSDKPAVLPELDAARRGSLIVVGHRFRNKVHRPGVLMPAASARASALRNEN